VRRASALLGIAAVLGLPAGASAAGLAVTTTTTADLAGPGSCPADPCSVRQAIAYVGAAGTVQLRTPPAGSDTYQLAQGPLTIGADVTVRGTGAASTALSGAGASRVFVVQPGATLQLDALTVTGGASADALGGGAILVDGTARLQQVAVTGSTATGVVGSVGVGGGIADRGALELLDSSVSDDGALAGAGPGAQGGGVFAAGTLTVTNSTITRDTASGGAGAGLGGGIALTAGSGSLSSATVADDTASGAGASGGDLYASGGTLDLRDAFVALGDAQGAAEDCAGPGLSSLGWNLSDGGDCPLGAPGDQARAVAAVSPPASVAGLLGVRPSPFSAAIDAGDPAGCADAAGHAVATDEVGVPRGTRCDIGALESAYPPVFAGVPSLAGKPGVGRPLDCDHPEIDGAAPISLSYAWLRDGSPIAGAVGASYLQAAADGGHGVACSVTATNADGSTTAQSVPLSVPSLGVASASARAFAGVSLMARRFTVRGGRIRVGLACPSGAGYCTGRLLLRPRPLGGRLWGSAAFALAGGAHRSVTLRLDGAARRRLAASRGRPVLAVALTVAHDGAGLAQTRSWTVSLRGARRG
jgi:hypothetical protein